MSKRVPDEADAAAVRQAAAKMGENLRSARQARSWTQDYAAWRASVSLPTYKRMEAGDPAVGLEFWLRAWLQLGLLDLWAEATDPHRDTFGERCRCLQRARARVRRPSTLPEHWDY
jgi:DNA-binding XRE family transcriptional regulator